VLPSVAVTEKVGSSAGRLRCVAVTHGNPNPAAPRTTAVDAVD
jgi:hypothetical protein